MMLSELIRDQVLEVCVMFGAGIAVAMLYQVFSRLRDLFSAGKAVNAVSEILFWAGAALITGKFLYYCSYGQISVHVICAFATGVILWRICFYDIINNICAFLETKWNIEKKHGKEETKQSV